MAVGQKTLDQMRAYESSAAGDKDGSGLGRWRAGVQMQFKENCSSRIASLNRECGASRSPSPRQTRLEPLGKRRKECGQSHRPARAERAGASESTGLG